MKIEEIRKACFAGKTFTFNNVKIHEFDMSDGVFNIIYSLPSVENQPYCQGFDVKEISVYEPAKYDPCRRFKKGDEVRVVEWKGRHANRAGQVGFVVKDEDASGMVELSIAGWRNGCFYHACHIELVTPVEELEPYYVKETASVYEVFNRNENNSSVAIFFKSQYSIEKAKERAEAECDRLNADYRKEQK